MQQHHLEEVVAQTSTIKTHKRRLLKPEEAPDSGKNHSPANVKTTFVAGVQTYTNGSKINIDGWL